MEASIREPRAGYWAGLTATLLLASACGGGSSGGGTAPPPPVPPPAPPTAAELADASRFAAQATFGLPFGEIDALAREGREAWLDRQFLLPVGRHSDIVTDLVARRDAGEFAAYETDIEYLILFRRLAWWHRTVTSNDVLRQRVAFALSQIFVVSDNVDALIINPYALSSSMSL